MDAVACHEMYSFLDGFSGYNQVTMHPKDQEKTAFVTEWGVFVAVVMIFKLKTASTTFQRVIQEIFAEYIPAFMQVFLDDFAVYSRKSEHFEHLRLCLEQCRKGRLSLNLAKCAFGLTSGTLLGHIVIQEGIAVNPDKVRAILEAPKPTNSKALCWFLGQIRWHSRMIRYSLMLSFLYTQRCIRYLFNGQAWNKTRTSASRKCYLKFRWFSHLIGTNLSMSSWMHQI